MRMRGEKKEIIHVISNRLLKWKKKKKKKGQRGCSPSSPASFRQVPTTNMNSTTRPQLGKRHFGSSSEGSSVRTWSSTGGGTAGSRCLHLAEVGFPSRLRAT